MTRSLSRRLYWWHFWLFASAIAISLLLAWREMSHGGGEVNAKPKEPWQIIADTALESCVPFLLLGAISWRLIHRVLIPIRHLTVAAEHMHEDNLHRRLPLRGTGDELDRLTSVLNDLTGRMETSFARVREFTLHASHELKTPLTILRSGFEQSLIRHDMGEPLREQINAALKTQWQEWEIPREAGDKWSDAAKCSSWTSVGNIDRVKNSFTP
jgi:signal transduction histidine kinase